MSVLLLREVKRATRAPSAEEVGKISEYDKVNKWECSSSVKAFDTAALAAGIAGSFLVDWVGLMGFFCLYVLKG